MKTAGALLAGFVVLAASGCSRAETDEAGTRTAGDARALAARAGDQLADSWLTTKIQAQYFADDEIKARHIDVSTRDRIVTLRGHVESDSLREQAVNIARYTDGVARVEDRLTIGAPETATAQQLPSVPEVVPTTGMLPGSATVSGPLDDESVTSRIRARYFLDPVIKMRRIEVETRGSVVTLRGEVASDNERAQALLIARTSEGVDRVEDGLTVNAALAPAASAGMLPPSATMGPAVPHAGDEALRALVQMRLADPSIGGASIQVTAKDGVLLLEGTVASEAVKQEIITAVRGTEGVVQVIDRIQVP